MCSLWCPCFLQLGTWVEDNSNGEVMLCLSWDYGKVAVDGFYSMEIVNFS